MLSSFRNYLVPNNFILLGLIIIAIGVPTSNALMTLGHIILLLTWIFDFNYLAKLKRFFSNKVALAFSLLFFIHLLWLLNTANFNYALNDIKIKLPLFVMPFVLSAFKPINRKSFKLIFNFFIASIILSGIISTYLYFTSNITNSRELSPFISHIRLSLNICLGIFGSFYFGLKSSKKLVYFFITVFLIYYLFLLKALTGVIIAVILIAVSLIYFSYKFNLKTKVVFYFFTLMVIAACGLFINNEIDAFYNKYSFPELNKHNISENGEKFYHDTTSVYSNFKENGNYVWRNIAWKEIENAWNSTSSLPFNEKDLSGQNLDVTLIRYLTSKGVLKDKTAVYSLTDEEVAAIENGIANYKYLEINGIQQRCQKIIWEWDNYINGGNYSGHSVVMRLIFIRTGLNIIKNHLLFGVGTGDVNDAFLHQYMLDETQLDKQHQLRAHNQYLTFIISFGVVGGIIILLSWFFAVYYSKLALKYLFLVYTAIVLFSMLNEDTLETQAGVTFFAFFGAIFLLSEKD